MMKKDVMKSLFKQKPRSPIDLVRYARELLVFVETNNEARENKREEKLIELGKTILEIRTVLFGNGAAEPNPDACVQITQEFFKEDTFRLLVIALPKLDLGGRLHSTHVIANLQRQRVNSQLLASQYLEKNLDLMDILIPGYDEGDIALTYGAITRECIRHQCVARYVLESDHMKKFFGYTQTPNFEIATDAFSTFKELLTRHKPTVAEFLSKNFDWFFQEYNSQLLESSSYITRRQGIKLLADMLLDRSNSAVMVRYVSSLHNLRILMNLLRDSNKSIQLETFHAFKLFVANQNKPPEIVSILVTNKTKLLRLLANIEKEDEQFQADKGQIINEIATLGS
ncbi:putative MO25-like protein At5g47540 [Prosopis cineraria]|uniref:putative MO25-like protein At5g47540 n=1 Tax=Prosopis cineraria TaxID=364024 RepID=UPI00240EC5E0|nr:putative MO25-like protein At5g47540 [Prosopis cineraria]